jgi:hypothetical protein
LFRLKALVVAFVRLQGQTIQGGWRSVNLGVALLSAGIVARFGSLGLLAWMLRTGSDSSLLSETTSPKVSSHGLERRLPANPHSPVSMHHFSGKPSSQPPESAGITPLAKGVVAVVVLTLVLAIKAAGLASDEASLFAGLPFVALLGVALLEAIEPGSTVAIGVVGVE